MKISEKIYNLRKAYNMTQEDLAKIADATFAAVSQWEKDGRKPRSIYTTRICQHFGIDLNEFLDENNDVYDTGLPHNVYKFSKRKIPLIGEIACGDPIIADESAAEYVFVPENINADFALKCKGDSMIGARIYDGDIVYIRKQSDVNNGEIAAVVIEDEATLKRVYRFQDHLLLQPENPSYAPLVFWNNEAENIRIIGKAVAFTSYVL